jgi:lipoate-protein ligase A
MREKNRRVHDADAYRVAMRLLRSDSHDPYFNLALENILLDRGDEIAPVLVLYANNPCVVIGKNQVPWRECATGRMRADGIPLVRRISGGGTVFHDAGNLNYSFILPRDSYRQDEVFATVLRALKSLGLDAHVGANNGLFLGDRKFSGSAFCYRRQHVLHHGTLLVNTDLEKLRACCRAALPQIVTRAISSKPASVVNLREARPDLTTELLAEAIIRESNANIPADADGARVEERAAELRAWEFLWGHTPQFELQVGRFNLRVEQGLIASSEIPDFIGARFDREGLRRANFPNIGTHAQSFFQSLEELDF